MNSPSIQDRIHVATEFATQRFEAVNRKNHFLEVYEILRNEFKVSDENTLVAGILHDTVEDTNTSFEEIEHFFLKEVALLVDEVSHPKDYSGVQVQEYYEKLKHISLPAKTIKLADFLSHLRRLIGIYQRGEEASNPVFVENGRYAQDIIAVAETCPPSEAREIVTKLAHELLELHKKSPVWGV
jgi:(p)ppGpp synthase/HD superfamily hydrolase